MTSAAQALTTAWQWHQAGDVTAAEAVYRQVLDAQPLNASAWCYLGIACHDRRQLEEAETAYRRALELNPNMAVGWNNLGNTLRSMQRQEESLAAYDNALRLKPQYANAWRNKAAALMDLDRTEEARQAFAQAQAINSGDVESRLGLAAADYWSGRVESAIAGFQSVVEQLPEHAEAHKMLGMALLLKGRFAEGFAEYSWRIRNGRDVRIVHVAPLWDGAALAGRTLLLEAEQGMGDTIQFVRYAAEIKERHDCRIIVACEPALVPLLSGVEGVDLLLAQNVDRPPFHLWAPLMSLPGILQHDAQSFPRRAPYLAAVPEREAHWRKRLASLGGRKIGVVWQGSKANSSDRRRSFPLAQLAPLAHLPSVTLVSLQHGDGAEQLDGLTEFKVETLGTFDPPGEAFLDTAAIVKCLDLIVTADTSVAHLAGALGVPVWVALAHVPDWRWGLGGEDTCWYPTMRLFRQPIPGDWDSVFARMAQALALWNESGAVS